MSDLLPLKTTDEGSSALIRLLGRDCAPLQFVREFTQNSIEAIQRTGKPGHLLIDVNWDLMDFDPVKDVYKLSFTDTGDGMTGDEFCEFINRLASSGPQNKYQNYGVGAKIAAITRNEYGIMYESWKNGAGYQAWFHFEADTNLFGLAQLELPDGTYGPYITLDDEQMPDLIRENGEHGTRVTLLGMMPDQDTMQVPEGAHVGTKEAWLLRAINSRYFETPEDISIKVRVGYDRPRDNNKHNYLREAEGQRATCEKHKTQNGTIHLSDAEVHWYILNEKREGHGRENVKGHTASVNQGELFDYTDGRSNRATDFGIVFGAANVMLYIEPNEEYQQNTARSGLVDKYGNNLPWERWADEFREAMPKELKDYVERLMSEASKDSHGDSIRERLKNYIKMYRLTRYRRSKSGSYEIDEGNLTQHNTGRGSGSGSGATAVPARNQARMHNY